MTKTSTSPAAENSAAFDRRDGKPGRHRLVATVSVGVLVLGAAACGASNQAGGVLTPKSTTSTTSVVSTTTTRASTTTVAPTTVAPTTVAPTTVAPTTTASPQGGQGQGNPSSGLPTVDSDPLNAVYTPAVKPSTIYLSGDSSNIVTGLRWVGWDGKGATGYGTVDLQGCVPNCAQGSETPTPVTIYLNNPISGRFSLLTENIHGLASKNFPVPTS